MGSKPSFVKTVKEIDDASLLSDIVPESAYAHLVRQANNVFSVYAQDVRFGDSYYFHQPSGTERPGLPVAAPSPRPMPPDAAGIETHPPASVQLGVSPGEPCEISFLYVKLAGLQRIQERSSEKPDKVRQLLLHFHDFFLELGREHQGKLFNWHGAQGSLIFFGEEHERRAILSGLKLIASLNVFNIDATRNPFEEPIQIQLAATKTLIVFQLPFSRIYARDYGFLEDLAKRGTFPGEFCIAKTLILDLEPRIVSKFSPKGWFGGESIFVHNTVNLRRDYRSHADTLFKKIFQTREAIVHSAEASADDGGLSSEMRITTDDFYLAIDEFISFISSIDKSRQPRSLIEYIFGIVTDLIQGEVDIWEFVKKVDRERGLGPVVDSLVLRRSWPVLCLERTRDAFENMIDGEGRKTEDEISRIVGNKLRRFVRAHHLTFDGAVQDLDDRERQRLLAEARILGRELILIDILTSHRSHRLCLVDMLERERKHDAGLVDLFWQYADVIVQEDSFPSVRQRKDDKTMLQVLSAAPISDVRFSVLDRILNKDTFPSANELKEVSGDGGDDRVGKSLEVVWRCLLIGHPKEEVRRQAADLVSLGSSPEDLGSAGVLISRARVPLDVLEKISWKIKNFDSIEMKKLFFDCSRRNILAHARTARTKEDVAKLVPLIIILIEFDFLVETKYFERFDELLGEFLKTAENLGLRIRYFQKLQSDLIRKRTRQREPGGTLPAALRKRPLWVQRKLAGARPYLLFFLDHPIDQIACDTFRNVTTRNLRKVLLRQDINGALMRKILKEPAFFTNEALRVAALLNSKCTNDFGKDHIRNFGKGQSGKQNLRKIARSARNKYIAGLARDRLRHFGFGI